MDCPLLRKRSKWPTRTEYVLLADEILKFLRSQSFREWRYRDSCT